jgi:hypothetical protein
MRYLFALFLLLTSNVFAQSPVDIPQNEKSLNYDLTQQRLRFIGIFDYATASNSETGESLGGMGFGAVLSYALSKKWALGVGAKQSFTPGGGQSITTSFDGRATYAVTGALYKEKKKASIDGVNVIDSLEKGLGGFRIDLHYSQYNYNTSSGSIPFSGIGLSGYYEYQTNKNIFYQSGLRYDQTSNATQVVTPISFFFGVGLWF